MSALSWQLAWRTARQDLVLHALAAACIAMAIAVTCLVPRSLDSWLSKEARSEVAAAGRSADLTISAPLGAQADGRFELAPDLASEARSAREDVAQNIPSDLATVLGEPVIRMGSSALSAGSVDGHALRVRFEYVARDADLEVTYLEGKAPGSTGTQDDIIDNGGGALPVEVAVSEKVATTWAVSVGDKVTIGGTEGTPVTVVIAGIFTPTNPSDPAWQLVQTLTTPRVVDGSAARIDVAALVTSQSLPYADYAMGPGGMTATYVLPAMPLAFDASNAAPAAAEARSLASGRQVWHVAASTPTATTGLDRLLSAVLARADAARSQALVLEGVWVVQVGIAASLAFALVAARRRPVMQLAVERGASPYNMYVALAAEGAVFAVVAGATGLLVARVVEQGPTPWALVTAVMTGAALGPALAAAAQGQHSWSGSPAARRIALRWVMVFTLAAVAVGSTALALTLGSESGGADGLVVAAVLTDASLAALAATRMVTLVTARLRRAAARRRSAGALLLTARLSLPATLAIALVVTTATTTVLIASSASIVSGREQGSWNAVGADMVFTGTAENPVDTALIAQADGGTDIVAVAAVRPTVQVLGEGVDAIATLVAADTASLADVLHGASQSQRSALRGLGLGRAGETDPESATVRALASGIEPGVGLTVRWNDLTIPIAIVGKAPALPGGVAKGRVIVVDRDALAAAGMPLDATVMWICGDVPSQAVASAEAADIEVTSREQWKRHLDDSPIVEGTTRSLHLAWLGGSVLAVLMIGLWVGGGRRIRDRNDRRWQVLGVASHSRASVRSLEIAVPVAVAAMVGVATGFPLAQAVTGSLGLGPLAGSDGALAATRPWWPWLCPLALACLAAIPVGRPNRGDEPLGAVMRTA